MGSSSAVRLSFALLVALNLLNYIDRYVLAAVEPDIRRAFFPATPALAAAPATEQLMAAMAKTGSLATAFLLSYMIAAPLFGILADRMSRWVLVGISATVWTLASGASGLAPTFGLLVLTRCFVGVGEAGYGPAAPTMIADLYPVERRGTMLAWFYAAIPVGSALGYVLGGAVAEDWGWRAPFFLVVPPGLLLAAACFFIGPPARPTSQAERPRARLGDYLSLLTIPSYVLATLGMAAMTFAIGGFSFWMPAYLHDAAHAGDLATVNTRFGAITVVAGLAATLLGGWLGDVLRRYTAGAYFIVSAAGIVASAGFVVLMVHAANTGVPATPGSVSQPSPLLWLWIALAIFFLFLNTGPSNTILANVTPPAVRANAFALNILVIHALGDAISPPILGAIAGRSWNDALYVVCGVMILAGVLWGIGTPFLGRDTDRVERVAG